MKVVTDYGSAKFIKAGKHYEVIERLNKDASLDEPQAVTIQSESGNRITALVNDNCAHLHFNDGFRFVPTFKVTTDYDGCRYITAGKVYDAELLEGCDNLVTLVDDDGSEILTRIGYPSSHLNNDDGFRVVTEGEGEVMSDEFQGFEVGQQFRILSGLYEPDFEIGEVVTVKSVTESTFGNEMVGDIGKNRRIAPIHFNHCVEYLGMTLDLCPEAPEVHIEDATGSFWCDSTDRSYDTLEEALIDQAFYDWAGQCIEFREDQRETGALLLDYIPDSVKRDVALKALGITDGGEV